MTTARETAETIQAAQRPEDLFGSAATDSTTRTAARRRYHRLAALVHPDRVEAVDAGLASAAFARLAE
ncbi:hypothetical protein ACWELQ_45970, partial [Nocardia sp. NPDC004722]